MYIKPLNISISSVSDCFRFTQQRSVRPTFTVPHFYFKFDCRCNYQRECNIDWDVWIRALVSRLDYQWFYWVMRIFIVHNNIHTWVHRELVVTHHQSRVLRKLHIFALLKIINLLLLKTGHSCRILEWFHRKRKKIC